MQFFTLEQQEDFSCFVKFWSQFYFNKNQQKYDKFFPQDKLDKKSLVKFSKFRNNTENLNQAWQDSWPKLKEKIDTLNNFRAQEKINIHKFLNEFEFLRSIWKFYLLHWCSRGRYPIFDQFILTAQRFIQFQKIETMPYHDHIIEDFYFNHFVPDFYWKLPKHEFRAVKVYQALVSFGKFLSNLN